jgi:hypothetical protein
LRQLGRYVRFMFVRRIAGKPPALGEFGGIFYVVAIL